MHHKEQDKAARDGAMSREKAVGEGELGTAPRGPCALRLKDGQTAPPKARQALGLEEKKPQRHDWSRVV